MRLEIEPPIGLQPEGQKHNQDQPISGAAIPKPEVKIKHPLTAAQVPGPMPLSLAAADEVDKWVQARVPGQNSAHTDSVELSTEHRQFRFDQIDQIHPTIYDNAAAIVFHYKDSPVGPVHIVIIKLDLRDDAIPLSRAIAWHRIQVFPYGRYIQGTLADLTDSPPFDPAQCVDYYFRQQWIAGANAKLAAYKAAVSQPLENAKRTITAQAERVDYLESKRAEAEGAQERAQDAYAHEHARAVFLSRVASASCAIILIILIIIFVVRPLWN